MYAANPVGFHTTLTPEVHDRLVQAAREVIVPTQVAHRARIPKNTFHGWIKRGLVDMEEGNSTIYAQLANDYYHALSDVVAESIKDIRRCPKNYQALTWLLERCFRKDFGNDSELIVEILSNFDRINELLEKKDA